MAPLSENLRDKLGAAVVAIAVWIYVSQEVTDRIQSTAPLYVTAPEQSIVRITEPAQERPTIRVLITGSRGLVTQINTRDLEVRIAPEPAAISEERIVTLTVEHLLHSGGRPIPGGLKGGVTFAPERVGFKIYRIDERSLPVQPVVIGQEGVGEGFRFVSAEAESDVAVKAPVDFFRQYRTIETRPIPVAGRNKDFNVGAQLVQAMGEFPVKTAGPVNVRIRIAPVEGTRLVSGVRVRYAQAPGGEAVILEQPDQAIDLELVGPQPALDALKADDLQVIVLLDPQQHRPRPSPYAATAATKDLSLTLPAGLRLKPGSDPVVKFLVPEKK